MLKQFSWKAKVAFFLVFVMVASIILPLTAAKAAENPIRVWLDGTPIYFDADPVIENGTTLVQFRPIFEQLGFDIEWDGANKRITGVKQNRDGTELKLELSLNYNSATVNGSGVYMEVPPRLEKGNTLVPLRFVSEASGKDVKWDGVRREISITTGFERYTSATILGGESFLSNETAVEFKDVRTNIYNDGESIYVTWTKQESMNFDKYRFVTDKFYRSIYQNGKWVTRSELLLENTAEASNPVTVSYQDGVYFLKDASSVKALNVTEPKASAVKYVTNSLPTAKGAQEVFLPTYVDGKLLFIFRSVYNIETAKFKDLRIYTDHLSSGNTNYVDIKDMYDVLLQIPQGTQLFYDSSTKILRIVKDGQYRQLNTVTGDMVYDREGKDLTLPIVTDEEADIQGTILGYTNGQLWSLYPVKGKQTFRYVTLDSKFKNSTSVITSIRRDEVYNRTLAARGNKIQTLTQVEFGRKPSLQVVEFRK